MKQSLVTFILIFVLNIPATVVVYAEDATTTDTTTPTTAQTTTQTTEQHVRNFARPSGAADAAHVLNHLQNQVNKNDLSVTKTQESLTQLKTKADQLIKNRIDSLNKLLTRVQNDSRLTSDDKTSLTTDIQNAISGLQTLQTKIDADTDVTTMRTDAQQIFTNYKVYAIFEPKMQLLIAIGNLLALDNKLIGYEPQIQSVLDTLKSQGADTTTAQAALDDMKTQLTTINTKLTTDKTTVDGVSIASTNATATFTTVRQDLASVRQLFATVRSDLAKMLGSFKGTTKANNTGVNPGLKIRPSGAVNPDDQNPQTTTSATPNTQ